MSSIQSVTIFSSQYEYKKVFFVTMSIDTYLINFKAPNND